MQDDLPPATPTTATNDVIGNNDATAGIHDDVTSLAAKFEGPIRSFVRNALEQLDAAATRSDVVIDDVMQRVVGELVTSYGQLNADERPTVDRQLVDMLYVLTSRGGLDVNSLCDVDKRRTALHVLASMPGSGRFIRALYTAGAKASVSDYRQQTALHIAVKCGDVNNVQALLDCATDVNQQDWVGQTALHLASTGQHRLPVLRLLIRSRSNVSLTDAGGRTALHVAARSGRPELVRELVVHGKAGVRKHDLGGMTAVHLAAMHDFTGKSLDELLRHKSAAADVNAQDFVAHETPLHKAIRLNMLENALTLLNYGADPNVADATGRTVMHLAAASLTDIRVWNALLRKGGRVDACVVETASGGGGAEVAASGATQSTARTVANKLNNSVAKAVIAQFDSTDTSNSFGSERFQPHVTN